MFFFIIFDCFSVPYSPYFDHLKGYNKAQKTHNELVLIISFEDMKQNPGESIRKIGTFIGINLSAEELEAIKLKTSFEEMKKNPKVNYEHWDLIGIRRTNESKFMRKGLYQ